MRIGARVFVPLFLLAALGTARGQYTNSYGYTFNNPISASCNAIVWDKMNSRLVYRLMLKKRGYSDSQLGQMSTDQMLAALGGSSPAEPEAGKPAQTAATAFRPASRPLLLPAMAKSLVQDRAQQDALLEIMAQGLQGYEKEAASAGLKNDVAGAMAFLIASSYYVYNDGLEPDENGTELLARALQQSLDTPAFRQIADEDKQRFYELMIGLGTYLGVAYRQAVTDNDASLSAQLKGAAADALRGFLKLDPDTVRITAAGLESAQRQFDVYSFTLPKDFKSQMSSGSLVLSAPDDRLSILLIPAKPAARSASEEFDADWTLFVGSKYPVLGSVDKKISEFSNGWRMARGQAFVQNGEQRMWMQVRTFTKAGRKATAICFAVDDQFEAAIRGFFDTLSLPDTPLLVRLDMENAIVPTSIGGRGAKVASDAVLDAGLFSRIRMTIIRMGAGAPR
jgi:hypothetical protein